MTIDAGLHERALDALWSTQSRVRPDVTFPPVSSEIRYDLGQGIPAPETFPRAELARLCREVLDERAEVLEYFDVRFGEGEMVVGPRGLRDAIAEFLTPDGETRSHEQVMLTAGSMEGLAAVGAALVDPGDGVVVEELTYHRPVVNMRVLGATVETVSLDDDGLDPEDVATALARLQGSGHRPKLLYTIASLHSPLGVTLSLDRRRRLLEVAEHWGVAIVEDNVYRLLRFDGDDVPTLASLDTSGRVISVDSFSKTIAPALRIGWVSAAHRGTIEAIARVRTDLGVSQLLARVVERFVRDGLYFPHIERVKDVYRRKRDVVVTALEQNLAGRATWRVPPGSMYQWIELDDDIDADEVARRAAQLGVLLRPGSVFAMKPGTLTHGIRLAYGRTPIDDLVPAIELFGRAVDEAR